jgi:flagellar biosynthesis chaperone FliJ
MKTTNYSLDETPLGDLLDIENLQSQKNILIQIFCGEGQDTLQKITSQIMHLLPNTICIGTTTDGEIKDQSISTKQTVLSLSIFDSTSIKSAEVISKDSFKNGVDLCKALVQKDTKLLILFTDGTTTNGEEFLKGIESINKDVVIAGGMAGDNGDFIQTFISHGSNVLESGAVGVSLSSENLNVHNSYSFNWSPIGVEHQIDRVDANRVYSIDGKTPVDFYSKYLGEDVANALPATGIEFPLIIEKNGIKIARAVIAKHADGSLSFAGNLNEGDRVRLGFGNAEMIINQPASALEKFCDKSIETFFLYSCMARRRYMPGFIQVEIEPFASLAPTSGFFTYAEFYHHNGKNELLNQTLTAVALSESLDKNILDCRANTEVSKEFSEYATTIKALTHLIAQSSADLEAQAKKLEEERKFSQEILAKQKLFLRHAVHETSTPLAVIMSNVELYELVHNKNEYLSNIEAAMKNVFTIYDDLAYLVERNELEYPKRSIDLVDYVRSRIDFFKLLALQADLTFKFNIECEEAIINFNETKLQRIVDNNLTNAIKYSKDQEKILIRVTKNREYPQVQIRSKSTHIIHPNKIFDAYYQEDGSTRGFGLGLNLVKQLCDEENVLIEVVSDKELTSFTYTFKGETL